MNLEQLKSEAREKLQTAGADGFAIDLDLDELDKVVTTVHKATIERAVEVVEDLNQMWGGTINTEHAEFAESETKRRIIKKLQAEVKSCT